MGLAKASEKTLELNVGAEIPNWMRCVLGYPFTYLQGLTQREEAAQGADFLASLDPNTKIFAFQFKAPTRAEGQERVPYRYTLRNDQHQKLYSLAQGNPNSVYYVFPCYATLTKVSMCSPHLLCDTWFLPVDLLPPAVVFGGNQTKTIYCDRGLATINPEFPMKRWDQIALPETEGIPIERFAAWYREEIGITRERPRRNPWLIRGLKVAVASRTAHGGGEG